MSSRLRFNTRSNEPSVRGRACVLACNPAAADGIAAAKAQRRRSRKNPQQTESKSTWTWIFDQALSSSLHRLARWEIEVSRTAEKATCLSDDRSESSPFGSLLLKCSAGRPIVWTSSLQIMSFANPTQEFTRRQSFGVSTCTQPPGS